MNLTYHQSKRIEKVVTDYSRALEFETAKKYINAIVGSALAVAEKDNIPSKAVFDFIINELRHYYKNNVAATNSIEKATEVLTTLQDRLNLALGKESKIVTTK